MKRRLTRIILLAVLLTIIAASFYTFSREQQQAHFSLVSSLLLKLHESDTRLDREVLRMTSFQLDFYKPKITTGQLIQDYLEQLAKAKDSHVGSPLPEQTISTLQRLLINKIDLVESLELHMAQLKKNLQDIPPLIVDFPASKQVDQIKIITAFNHLLRYDRFPERVDLVNLTKEVNYLVSDERDSAVIAVGKKIQESLDGFKNADAIRYQIFTMPMRKLFDELVAAVESKRLQQQQFAGRLWGSLLVLTGLLGLLLVYALYRLECALKTAKQSADRLQDAVASLPESFALFDHTGTLVVSNKKFLDFYPWLKKQLSVGSSHAWIREKNKPYLTLVSVAGEHLGEAAFSAPRQSHYLEQLVDGRWYLASDNKTKDGGLVCIRSDLTETKESEKKLRVLSSAIEQSPVSIMVADINGKIEYVNPKFEAVSGYSSEEAIGHNHGLLECGEKTDEEYADIWNTLLAGKEWMGTFSSKRKNGSLYWESVSIFPVRNETHKITHFVVLKEDITQRKEHEEQIHYQANFDVLTGLPNRTLLKDRLLQAMQASKRENALFALLFIDLDRFKAVNDSFGHVTGDELLQKVSERLNQTVRNVDTLARFGGDEFVLLLPGIHRANEAAVVANKLIQSLSRPFELVNSHINIGASIGISIYPNDVGDVEALDDIANALLSNADMAMYQAKDTGRNRYHFFQASMQEQVKMHMTLEQDLRKALDEAQLFLQYQPILEAGTENLYGVEALVRWQHPEKGLIMPGDFIRIAEETGLIGPLGEWVFKAACTQVSEWIKQYGLSLRLSINLSARQRGMGFTADKLLEITQSCDIPKENLVLEITESLLLEESNEAVEWLNSFKDLGLNLAVDDFGTGYSSLAYLKRFPVDILKIDRSFVQDLPDDTEDASLVTAIIAMADSLNLKVVAEGVENQAQQDYLKDLGCQYLQGYYFSKPVSADEIIQKYVNK